MIGHTLLMQEVARRGLTLKYSDDQPREPAGSPEGGRFAGGSGGLPAEPGTTPVSAGMIRGYHYTGQLDQVLQEGLDVSHARGSTYGEPNGIWMSTVKPGNQKDYVEVHVSPQEIALNGPDLHPYQGLTPEQRIAEYNQGAHDFILALPKIAPDRFVTHFTAWHETARYLLNDAVHYPFTRAKIEELQKLRQVMSESPQAKGIDY